ncbi:SIR2 family NAD-dependent protein deacylase [Clostridium aminobutyricum]|uniref:protein acetyllysine N-acetyltransferase n=1 Tax=Clostridium aminobutyricum TaxID=33953 RepID=A0A939D9G1_CLOAM|nr:Sir2 family NAD-dependent protein deacetylase [Clostridium aminobutyricum]MBN7773512.1 Sir2 silent information regulator family NAD-dependent deacetylase [Clostridium aminobutyricum]
MNNKKIEQITKYIKDAEAIVIGAGSGLSTAAGLTYCGKRFEDYFSEFIERYGMEDMYSAGFYPFQTQEEKWAYWSRHIYYNRYDIQEGKVYMDLYQLVKEGNHFVLTTNVDHQFWLAGFDDEKIFATQGDYGLFQCKRACHKKLYDNEIQVRKMIEKQKDCKIPRELIPKCPKCGGNMEVNLRSDSYFVENEKWNQANRRYQKFLHYNQAKRILFLELGVGMNTPMVIKYPFWQMTYRMKNAKYVCVNLDEANVLNDIAEKSICINADIADVVEELVGR